MDEENPPAEISPDNEGNINQEQHFTGTEIPLAVMKNENRPANWYEKNLFKFDLLTLINYK